MYRLISRTGILHFLGAGTQIVPLDTNVEVRSPGAKFLMFADGFIPDKDVAQIVVGLILAHEIDLRLVRIEDDPQNRDYTRIVLMTTDGKEIEQSWLNRDFNPKDPAAAKAALIRDAELERIAETKRSSVDYEVKEDVPEKVKNPRQRAERAERAEGPV